MWYVLYTLDVYEVIDKAQLAAALLLGGMGIWGNTWALVWSNIPSPLSSRHKAVPHVARCLCFFRRAGFSIWFSIVTGTMGCSNRALAKRAWQPWVSKGLQGSCRPLLHCHSPLGSLPQEQWWPRSWVLPGALCWDPCSPLPTPRTLPIWVAFSSWGIPAACGI